MEKWLLGLGAAILHVSLFAVNASGTELAGGHGSHKLAPSPSSCQAAAEKSCLVTTCCLQNKKSPSTYGCYCYLYSSISQSSNMYRLYLYTYNIHHIYVFIDIHTPTHARHTHAIHTLPLPWNHSTLTAKGHRAGPRFTRHL